MLADYYGYHTPSFVIRINVVLSQIYLDNGLKIYLLPTEIVGIRRKQANFYIHPYKSHIFNFGIPSFLAASSRISRLGNVKKTRF